MKRIISALMIVFMIALMMFSSTNKALASDDNLDIEKVAIQALKSSQAVQSINRQVTESQKNYQAAQAGANSIRGVLKYSNSYQLVEQVILLPFETNNAVTLTANMQTVTQNAIRLSAYSAYINLLKANYAVNIQKGLVDSLNADYQKARQQYALGLMSEPQLRLTEINYLKSVYNYNSAKNNLSSATMAVNNLMGEPDISKTYSALQDYNIIPAAQTKSLNDYINLALNNRLDIKSEQTTLDTKKKEYQYGQAEIPTDFQFYCQQQQNAIDSTQNDLDMAKINVQLDITDRYKLLENAMNNLEAMKDLDDLAASNYAAAQTQFSNTQITLKELDDAKLAKAQADMNYKNAQLDAWLAQTSMNTACGAGLDPSTLSGLLMSLKPLTPAKNNPDPSTNKGFNR